MDALAVIHKRASYRGKYRATPVPRSDLQAILDAVLDAPSGCNKQTTSLIAVDDPEILAALKQLIVPPKCETAPALI